MGELHLEIIVDRLLREFKVEANVGAPQVVYRELHPPPEASSTTPSTLVSPVVRASTVTAIIDIEPNEPGRGYEFINAVVGGDVPKESHRSYRSGYPGRYEGPVSWPVTPVEDVKVTLKGGL